MIDSITFQSAPDGHLCTACKRKTTKVYTVTISGYDVRDGVSYPLAPVAHVVSEGCAVKLGATKRALKDAMWTARRAGWQAEREERNAARAQDFAVTYAMDLARVDALLALPTLPAYVRAKLATLASNVRTGAWEVKSWHHDLLNTLEREATLPPSHHVGTVGEKYSGVVECVRVYETFGAYGSTNIHTFRAADGAILVWFASGAARCAPGDRVTVRGSVKSHNDYQGVPQTNLTRCNVEICNGFLPSSFHGIMGVGCATAGVDVGLEIMDLARAAVLGGPSSDSAKIFADFCGENGLPELQVHASLGTWAASQIEAARAA